MDGLAEWRLKESQELGQIVQNRLEYLQVGGGNILDFYGECSNFSITFLYLLSNKMLVFWTGIYKMLVRIASRGDPDQTAEAV